MPDSHYLLLPSQLMEFRLQFITVKVNGETVCADGQWLPMFELEPNALWDSLIVTQTWDRDAGDLDLVLTCIWH